MLKLSQFASGSLVRGKVEITQLISRNVDLSEGSSCKPCSYLPTC